MAITSGASPGIIVTTAAKSGTVKSFTGGKVRLEDPITTGNNGNLMASPVYAGRLIYIDGGTGVGQTRFITAETLSQGDGDDADLDVSEAWATDPDGTSTFQISYIIEDAVTLNGITLFGGTQVYESSRRFTVGSGGGTFAFFFLAGDKAFEWRDNGSSTVGSVTIADGGRYDNGYLLGAAPVQGGFTTCINNTDGELALDCKVGSETNFYDFSIRCALANNTIEMDGGTHVWTRGKMFACSEASFLKGVTIEDFAFEGLGTATDTLRIEDDVVINSLVLTSTNGFESLDDGLTETLEARNTVFANPVARNVRVHDDKTWDFVNPVGWVADSTAISFEIDDLNEVNKLFSLAISVSEPDGTAIVDADCYVYEGTLNQDLPTANRVDTDSNGEALTDVLVEKYTFPSSVFTTVTSGAHALKIYEWLKVPFVTVLTPDFTVTGGLFLGVVLIDDPDIVQTTQATAITNGSGITIEQPANPTQLLSYDTGTVAFVVGDVVDGAGGAQGTVTEISEGDTASGRIHLRLRNGTAFVAGEDLDVSAVKRAQATNPLVALDYSTHIDGNAISLQNNYDYWAARQAEDTIGTDAITTLIWGEGEHAQIVFGGGGDFRTERNVANTDGVFVSDRGAGTLTYLTADDGTQYTPPVSVTLEVTCAFGGVVREAVRVRIEETDGTLIANGETNASGIFSASFNYTADLDVNVVIRQKIYKFQKIASEITAAGLTVPVALTANKTINLP